MADYRENAFPEDDATRGRFPMADGLLDYFPNALAAVAEVSKIGNDKHNPGEPMHHARGKSMDHRNKIMRHLCDAGGKDSGGVRHSAYVAWRALALLQEELEREEGAPMARAARIAMAEQPKTGGGEAVMTELRPFAKGDKVRVIDPSDLSYNGKIGTLRHPWSEAYGPRDTSWSVDMGGFHTCLELDEMELITEPDVDPTS